MTSQTPEAQPVQGPRQPTHTDLIWATASSQAALDDPTLSVQDRQSYLEAEAATYIAASHLGLEEVTAEQYAAELAAADAASAGMDSHLGEPTLADWVLTAPEAEAGL
jgi:hypothetical protein